MSAAGRTLDPRPVAVVPSGLPRAATAADIPRDRPVVRLTAFTALAAYGIERWATLLRPAPGWRLAGLLALAVALAGGVPPLARRSRLLAGALTVALILLAFPVSGLRWHWLTHLRVAASADRIGHGLTQLPNILVPYLGAGADVRLVIVLGAAVLVLDAAAVLAFSGGAGSSFGDGRRAAAALPLTALAVVPSTLVRPEWPYVQGLLLFGMLAAFLWGERVRPGAGGSAVLVVALTGVAAAIVAPHADQGAPWVDYRAWAGTTVRRSVDTFDWNQTYGPLRWPRAGHEVLAVQAATGEYWKAEDLDTFNGYAWVQSPPTARTVSPAVPAPARQAVARWTQTIRVTIEGMQTQDVIAAGVAGPPSAVPGGAALGSDVGSWVAGRILGPGTTYRITTYSPHPTTAQLAAAGLRYPVASLAPDLTLSIPELGRPAAAYPQVRFPRFGSAGALAVTHARGAPAGQSVADASAQAYLPETSPQPTPAPAALLKSSPYAAAYTLARHLAAGSPTPIAYVQNVLRYLGHGFTYNENPAVPRWPLEGFLFSTRQGYCQQFSGAMALLLRMGGIPARVATGFTAGVLDTSTHQWLVTDTDAHAWVEAWFPRYGWVRFDPTPASAPARAAQRVAAAQPALTRAQPAPPETIRRAASIPGSTPATVHHSRTGGVGPWLIAGAAALLLGLGLLAGVLRPASVSAEDLVDELERALRRTRRPLGRGVTLVSLEQRLSASPDAAAYVRRLRLARFGGAGAAPTVAQRRALRRELGRGLGPVGRLRALWALPPRRPRRPAAPTAG